MAFAESPVHVPGALPDGSLCAIDRQCQAMVLLQQFHRFRDNGLNRLWQFESGLFEKRRAEIKGGRRGITQWRRDDFSYLQ